MKLLLLDGGPASGKNSLGLLMVQEFKKRRIESCFLDLDTYVENLNPTWIWKDEQLKNNDLESARMNFAQDVDNYLQKDFVVIAISERFLTQADITCFLNRLTTNPPIHLFHLSVPFSLRKQRLEERGRHTLIDLDKDQQDRDSNAKWFGYVYENSNSPEQDAMNIMKLIQENYGFIDL